MMPRSGKETDDSLLYDRAKVLSLLYLIALILFFFAVRFFMNGEENGAERFAVSVIACYWIPLLFFFRLPCGKNTGWGNAGFSPKFFPPVFCTVIGTAALYPSGIFLSVACGKPYAYQVAGVLPENEGLAVSLLVFVALPAVTEEIAVRGVITEQYRQVPLRFSLFLSAILSGVMFFPSLTALPFFVLAGLAMGVLRVCSFSVYPSLLASLTVRAMLFLLYPRAAALANGIMDGENGWICLLFSAAVSAVVFVLLAFLPLCRHRALKTPFGFSYGNRTNKRFYCLFFLAVLGLYALFTWLLFGF